MLIKRLREAKLVDLRAWEWLSLQTQTLDDVLIT